MSGGAESREVESLDRDAAAPIGKSQLLISIPGLEAVEGPARASFTDAIEEYSSNVLKEASNLEFAHRAKTSSEVQYTSSHFASAVSHVSSLGYVPRKKRLYPLARVASPICFLVAGVSMPMAMDPNNWGGWGFVAGGTGVLATILSIYAEYNGKSGL